MNIEHKIRNLAKSPYYQNIYRASKELHGINMFLNQSNFSGPQNLMLYWCKIYSMAFDEMQSGEYENLKEWVIDDHIRFDAFLYWRSLEFKKLVNKNKSESRKMKKKKQGTHKIYRGKTG